MRPEAASISGSDSLTDLVRQVESGEVAAKSAAAPVLSVENLSIGFKGIGSNVVDGVSFSVAQGETLCLVGESGCGKSITALSLMGLLPSPPAKITSGTAVFEGKDLLSLPKSEISEIRGDKIAMVFQEPMTSLNPVYTVGEQISEAVRRHRPVTKTEALERALEMLQRVRIPAPEKRLKEYPHQLSGGMRQRVMIAMAPDDLARVANVAEVAGDDTRATFAVLGKSRALRATVRLTDMLLLTMGLIAALAMQILTIMVWLAKRSLRPRRTARV